MSDKHDFVERVLSGLKGALSGGQFIDLEKSIIELKDLSTGSAWTSLKQTVCAYLNTKGGYVFCGIRERNGAYTLTGFDRNNESRLIELRYRCFQNDGDLFPDLSDYMDFEYATLNDRTVAIIKVRSLSEDLKYLKFQGIYYERVLTQDRVIPDSKLLRRREYKAELEYSKEISPVPKAGISDLDLDKINAFITRINATGRKETPKKDEAEAEDFLRRRYAMDDRGQITVLGLLLFGKEPFRYIEYRAEADCYAETRAEIGRDKKIYQGDVLYLMDSVFAFVWGHIRMGVTAANGGSSLPEYPERLIREVVNNALAHRDYTQNQFVTVKVNPGLSLEIKNPGSFKQKMLLTDTSRPNEIRRIVPGIAETKNPKLANVLKAFDKIESQGLGMAVLVETCLDNLTDLPYFDLSIPDTITLVLRSGKLLDEPSRAWLDFLEDYIRKQLGGKPLTREHALILTYLRKSEQLNQKRFYTVLLGPSNNHFGVLAELKAAGLIVEHSAAGSEQIPTYVLDRALTRDDFLETIEAQTAQSTNDLDDISKKVLNIVYKYGYYKGLNPKSTHITPLLYQMLYSDTGDPKTYESLGRKVRKICAELCDQGFLVKHQDKSYSLRSSVN